MTVQPVVVALDGHPDSPVLRLRPVADVRPVLLGLRLEGEHGAGALLPRRSQPALVWTVGLRLGRSQAVGVARVAVDAALQVLDVVQLRLVVGELPWLLGAKYMTTELGAAFCDTAVPTEFAC